LRKLKHADLVAHKAWRDMAVFIILGSSSRLKRRIELGNFCREAAYPDHHSAFGAAGKLLK